MIAEGKIAEVWDIYDRLWVWQQLGVLPEIKEALAKQREELRAQQFVALAVTSAGCGVITIGALF